MPRIQIFPSLLAADMGRLEEACMRAEAAGVDGLHVDVMDGHFVRNLSMGPEVVRMARRCVKVPLSVHLMVARPDVYAEPFLEAGADTVLIHVEAPCEPRPVLKSIRRWGARAGIVLNPETPAESVFDLLGEVDEVLCMTVHPGFGGQAFIPEVLPKIAALRRRMPELDISADGGLNDETVLDAAVQGANIFHIGTALFDADDMGLSIGRMRERIGARLRESAG
ncbi:MAG: ribulose-phosphate 3-epimerase [Verrucomicrobiota bacterium]